MAELTSVMEPKALMANPFKILEWKKIEPRKWEGKTIQGVTVKFEDAYYNNSSDASNRARRFSSMEIAAKRAFDNADDIKDRKGIIVGLPVIKDDSKTWTEKMNEALKKNNQGNLMDDDLIVSVSTGYLGVSEYVVLRKKTEQEKAIV